MHHCIMPAILIVDIRWAKNTKCNDPDLRNGMADTVRQQEAYAKGLLKRCPYGCTMVSNEGMHIQYYPSS